MRRQAPGGILCAMHEDSARRFGAVANAIVVLFLVLVPMSANGSEIDHEEVRPWGCRTCLVPSDPAPQLPADPGLGPIEDPGLGPIEDGDERPAAASPREPLRLGCGDSCPPLVEIMAAAAAAQCQPCPTSPEAAPSSRLD